MNVAAKSFGFEIFNIPYICSYPLEGLFLLLNNKLGITILDGINKCIT